ncbi:MAG: adenosylcobinamide-phosphate synthase CbiB [Propionibacteriaceae bacterium]|jgi:adenosylcobinamide-phosphate synthase|nr:adenosylcobinamide-phosphate synthase CbiB [Propionibacteriaceae bacterium]
MLSFVPLLATSTVAITTGALLDRLIGDPRQLPHLVRGLGTLITRVERVLVPSAGLPSRTARRRGTGLVVVTLTVAGLGTALLLGVAYAVSLWLGGAVEAILVWQCLAVKSLRDESAAVRTSLIVGDLGGARSAVSMIVGRDTAGLDATGVARAAVETVAENTTDAVVAPFAAMLVAGGVGGVVYKAVNTLDSMVGYRNARYRDFGRTAARVDDVVNWLPARVAAGMMVAASRLTGDDARGAYRIWRRDHARHASPNSGQTEAACAGALGIRLGGPATYGGERSDKPTLGDALRPVGADDIARAGRLMSATAWLALAVVVGLRAALWGVIVRAGG